ncbi:cysteine hydrolase family protein [Rhodovulum sp. MB263]|uniref:cysteine hydrolase family protein n=1 Tax=Rhodovulum sp. (strain MB263) TaxID=308754 RepID=UPI0018C87AE9|nr:cysteine hydrolase family protein [Rhodovulum sp. MB263]
MMMSKALILVDVQNEYFADGKLPLPDMDEALTHIEALLTCFRSSRLPIFHIQHFGLTEGGPFSLGSPGAELHDRVKPRLGMQPPEIVIPKYYTNGFRMTWLAAALQGSGVTEVVVAGAMVQNCIDATVRAADDFGFKVTVASDACAAAPVTLKDGQIIEAATAHDVVLAALSNVADVRPTTEVIAQIEQERQYAADHVPWGG